MMFQDIKSNDKDKITKISYFIFTKYLMDPCNNYKIKWAFCYLIDMANVLFVLWKGLKNK